jgi:hypothetical protein
MKKHREKILPVSAIAAVMLLGHGVTAKQAPVSTALSVILHVPSLVDSINEIAGHPVRVLEARVLEVLDPRVVVVEAATNYRTLRGQRDRILVFVTDSNPRNATELALRSTVTVVGTARTLLSLRTTNEVPWPARLDPQEIDRLELQGAVVGATIETAEGTRF